MEGPLLAAALLSVLLLTGGCIGTSTLGTEEGEKEEAAPSSEGTQREISKTVHLWIDAETEECAEIAPRCGVVLWNSEEDPPTTHIEVDTEDPAEAEISARWNASTPANRELRLMIRQKATEEQILLEGEDPINRTLTLEPGAYAVSIGAHPEPLAGFAVDQRVTYAVKGPVVERG